MKSALLPENYLSDPEKLLKQQRKNLRRTPPCNSEDQSISSLEDQHTNRSLTSEFVARANKSLREFSAPTTANIHTRPEVDVGDNGFELKPGLINIVQANQFSGKAHEDASTHLQTLFGDF